MLAALASACLRAASVHTRGSKAIARAFSVNTSFMKDDSRADESCLQSMLCALVLEAEGHCRACSVLSACGGPGRGCLHTSAWALAAKNSRPLSLYIYLYLSLSLTYLPSIAVSVRPSLSLSLSFFFFFSLSLSLCISVCSSSGRLLQAAARQEGEVARPKRGSPYFVRRTVLAGSEWLRQGSHLCKSSSTLQSRIQDEGLRPRLG